GAPASALHRSLGEDTNVDAIGVADQAIERRSAQAVAPAAPQVMPDEYLRHAALVRILENGLDRVLAFQRLDLRLLRPGERQVPLQGEPILLREVALHHVD